MWSFTINDDKKLTSFHDFHVTFNPTEQPDVMPGQHFSFTQSSCMRKSLKIRASPKAFTLPYGSMKSTKNLVEGSSKPHAWRGSNSWTYHYVALSQSNRHRHQHGYKKLGRVSQNRPSKPKTGWIGLLWEERTFIMLMEDGKRVIDKLKKRFKFVTKTKKWSYISKVKLSATTQP